MPLGRVRRRDLSTGQLRVVDHIRVELAHLVVVGRGVEGTVLLGVEGDGELLLQGVQELQVVLALLVLI